MLIVHKLSRFGFSFIPEEITKLAACLPLLCTPSETEPTSDQFGMSVEVDTCYTNPRNYSQVLDMCRVLGSDRMLYKRYALTETEIALIESKIRPMERKNE